MQLRVFLFFIITGNIFAQNLVPNSGFETTSGCGGNGQLTQATGWNCPPGGITLADLYTPCASTGASCSNFNTLGSMAGCSNACDGNKYTGQIAYYTACPNCREYLQRQLSAPLTAGTTYFLSFNTKLAPYARYGCNRMGMYVSVTQPTQATNQPILVTPQIQSGLITNKVNWTTVSGTFIATGGENYVSIGVHYNNASLTIFDFGSSLSGCALASSGAYYLVDNVWIAPVAAGTPPACAPNSSNCVVGLPVELSGFDAAYADNVVTLKWTTSSERNNDYFTVERSGNGEDFETLKVIKAGGSESGNKIYEAVDETPRAGISYYRLRQTDYDGAFKYSEARVVNVLEDAYGFSIHPNPAEDYIEMIFSQGSNESAALQVRDVLNRIIYSSRLNPSDPNFTTRLDISGYTKGVYFIYLIGTKKSQGVKFVKQ